MEPVLGKSEARSWSPRSPRSHVHNRQPAQGLQWEDMAWLGKGHRHRGKQTVQESWVSWGQSCTVSKVDRGGSQPHTLTTEHLPKGPWDTGDGSRSTCIQQSLLPAGSLAVLGENHLFPAGICMLQ